MRRTGAHTQAVDVSPTPAVWTIERPAMPGHFVITQVNGGKGSIGGPHSTAAGTISSPLAPLSTSALEMICR